MSPKGRHGWLQVAGGGACPVHVSSHCLLQKAWKEWHELLVEEGGRGQAKCKVSQKVLRGEPAMCFDPQAHAPRCRQREEAWRNSPCQPAVAWKPAWACTVRYASLRAGILPCPCVYGERRRECPRVEGACVFMPLLAVTGRSWAPPTHPIPP